MIASFTDVFIISFEKQMGVRQGKGEGKGQKDEKHIGYKILE